MDASMMAQAKALEDENRRLKKIFAELGMQDALLKDSLGRKRPGHLNDAKWPRLRWSGAGSVSPRPASER